MKEDGGQKTEKSEPLHAHRPWWLAKKRGSAKGGERGPVTISGKIYRKISEKTREQRLRREVWGGRAPTLYLDNSSGRKTVRGRKEEELRVGAKAKGT